MQKEMTVRICSTCNKPLNFKPGGTQGGLIVYGDYYHEGDCVQAIIPDDMTWEEYYDEQGGDDNEEAFWTEWEPEFTEGNSTV